MAKVEITNKLLKEAIADAEAVRQTAIENAKLSLEETFTPQIKSMLSRRLRAEAEGMEDEEEKEVEKKEAPEGEEKEAPKAAVKHVETEAAKELDPHTAEAEGGDLAASSDIGASDNKEPSPEAFDSAEDDMSGEAPADSDTDWYDDWSDADFDLDEVIKELEEDMKAFGAEEKEEEGEEEKEEAPEAEEKADEAYPDEDPEAGVEKPEIPAKTSAIGTEGAEQAADINKFVTEPSEPKMEGEHGAEEEGEEEKEEAPEAEEKEEKADEAYPDEDPEAGVEKPEIPAKTSAIGTKEESKAELAADVEKFVLDPSVAKMEGEEEKGHEEGEEELDLEEILRELEAEDEKKHAESEKMAALEKELAEYKTALEMVRKKLHEVNLLNAKLLFTNRIFRKDGLTNEQKVMVVENFDRATTVREVKMVYTVLVETLTSAAKAVKATKPAKKVVAEGFASKATPSTAPKTETAEVIAENSVAKRLQQLAGIIS